jgi:hypothetical protein
MDSPKMDASLAEVRQWRESLQGELDHLDSTSRIREIERRASEIMRRHGLELTRVDAPTRRPLAGQEISR